MQTRSESIDLKNNILLTNLEKEYNDCKEKLKQLECKILESRYLILKDKVIEYFPQHIDIINRVNNISIVRGYYMAKGSKHYDYWILSYDYHDDAELKSDISNTTKSIQYVNQILSVESEYSIYVNKKLIEKKFFNNEKKVTHPNSNSVKEINDYLIENKYDKSVYFAMFIHYLNIEYISIESFHDKDISSWVETSLSIKFKNIYPEDTEILNFEIDNNTKRIDDDTDDLDEDDNDCNDEESG